MPIRRELRPLYPAHWRELSRRVRFERAGAPARAVVGRTGSRSAACLTAAGSIPACTWRDRPGRPARWPDLEEMTRQYATRVVLAAAHLDNDSATTGYAISGAFASAAIWYMTAPGTCYSAGSPTGCAMPAAICSSAPTGMGAMRPWSGRDSGADRAAAFGRTRRAPPCIFSHPLAVASRRALSAPARTVCGSAKLAGNRTRSPLPLSAHSRRVPGPGQPTSGTATKVQPHRPR